MKNINKINQNCHPELVSGSMVESAWKVEDNHNGSCQRVNRFRTKSGMTGECGRSMVEMLGVLAIIGVLSVGGIAGYTMAMNKHRANEILNAASVRAMMITTQLAQGRKSAELSLAEFGEEKVQGVSFDKEYTDGAETFNLKLTWDAANPSVCTQIKNIVGENVTVNDGCTTFTYKNDLGSGIDAEKEARNPLNCIYDNSCIGTTCPPGTDYCDGGCYSQQYCENIQSGCPPESGMCGNKEGISNCYKLYPDATTPYCDCLIAEGTSCDKYKSSKYNNDHRFCYKYCYTDDTANKQTFCVGCADGSLYVDLDD